MRKSDKAMMRIAELDETARTLREMLKPGDTVYTVLRHVSRSGMQRSISLFAMRDGVPFEIDYWAAKVLGSRIDNRRGGIKVNGCGMDMGFHLVYNLSYCLFPDGFDCIGDKCSSNDHSNRENNAHHKDGGYALRHRWM